MIMLNPNKINNIGINILMKITDETINELFSKTDFGKPINESIFKKRYLLGETLACLVGGYWVNAAAFNIALVGGLIHDGKKNNPKELTALGQSFLDELNK